MSAISQQIYLYLYHLIGLLALILIHELGQLIAAKLLGEGVASFTVGVGPRAFGFTAGDTSYGVAWFPLGGYTKIEELENPDQSRSRTALLIMAAGPALCLLAAPGLGYLLYPGASEGPPAVVGRVIAEMPAEEAGLRAGDRITAIDEEAVHSWAEMRDTILKSADKVLRLTITRQGKSLHKEITPRVRHQGSKQGVIGISPFFEPARVVVARPDSPAGRAGLVTGDVIVEVDGQPIFSWQEMDRHLFATSRTVQVRYRRPREEMSGLAELERLPLRDAVVRRADGNIGLRPAAMTVHRVEPGSPAEVAGLRAGDRVIRVDGKMLRSWMELLSQLRSAPDVGHYISWITPEGARREARVALARATSIDEHGVEVQRLVFGAHVRELRLLPPAEPVGIDLKWWLSDSVLLALIGLVVAMVIFALKRALLPCWVHCRSRTEGTKRRTVIPLVLGVLCLCVGSCEAYRGSWGATMAWRIPPSEESTTTSTVGGPVMVQTRGENEPVLTHYTPGYDPEMRLLAIFGNAAFAVLGGVPLVLAVGLLRLRRWARLWTRVWAVAFLVASAALLYLVLFNDLVRYAGVAALPLLVIGWLFIGALPVAALVFLSRKRVKEAMIL